MNCTNSIPLTGSLKVAASQGDWIKMWAKITWQRMNRSSKRWESLKKKETNPTNMAKIEIPLKKFIKFLISVR